MYSILSNTTYFLRKIKRYNTLKYKLNNLFYGKRGSTIAVVDTMGMPTTAIDM